MEALLIEAELIRLHQPEFNILLKDDKSPIYLVIENVRFPAVKLVRKGDLIHFKDALYTLGPFSSAYKLKQVLRIARKIFPWCDTAEKNPNKDLSNHKPCFYYHLDLCQGACIGKISSTEYQQMVDQLILFLKGKKKEVIKNMNLQMKQYANELQFEKANQIKQKLLLIEDVTSQRYKLKPDLILPALHDSKNLDSLDHLRRILLETKIISTQSLLARIEGFDVSNLIGQNASVSMVVFVDGEPKKSEYRLFNIKNLTTPNDYQMIKQAISRRSLHSEWQTANLIIVDGGKGQIRAALSAYLENRTQPPAIIGIAKKPDRLILPIIVDATNNQLKIEYQEISLPTDHPALHLVQQVRDESHRFARKQHLRIRKRSFFKQ